MKTCTVAALVGLSFAGSSYAQETAIDSSPANPSTVDSTISAPVSDTVHALVDLTPASHPLTETRNLEKTVIRGVSRASTIKRQAYNVSAIDVTKLKEKNVTVTEVLNQSSGVVVREGGGMGSETTISLNGMSGNQVRTFVDGLPIDVFGPAMSLGNLPPNTIETIEVYKGVVPIQLGADGLGGAVNIKTTSRFTSYLDASYAFSSFNTHRSTLAGQWASHSAKAFIKVSGFHGYSDNDYEVTVRPRNANGTYQSPRSLPRFHDAYSVWSSGVEAGVFHRGWADLASVSYAYGQDHDDVQHAVSMDRVYGQVFTEWNSHTFGAKYRKRDLLVDGLSLTAYATYNDGFFRSLDTAARIYDWYGNFVPNVVLEKGESDWDKTYIKWNSAAIASNASLAYDLGRAGEASVNYAQSRYAVKSRDVLDAFEFVYDEPSIIQNHTYAAAYKLSIFGIWTTTAFAKLYRTNPVYRTYDYSESREIVNRADRSFPGYGLATTVFALPGLQGKFSYERAVRVPDPDEIFGDAVLQEANLELEPELSHNLNLGALGNFSIGDLRLGAEANAYYRGITGLIRQDYLGGPRTRFVNLDESVVTGWESEIGFDYRRLLEARANLTYDQAINTTRIDNGLPSQVYLDRIPNRPYLYGNALFAAHWPNPIGLPGKLSLSVDSRWVHSYYLFWESQGEAGTKFSIPGQLAHSASLVYAARADRYSLALECDNVTDEDLYDNFRQQKPGRAYSAKVRFGL
jgi:outer membrane receptor protein involved in Fe transport